jgi:hypothetical protein
MANITQINGLKITAESASYATTAQSVLGSITSAATASLALRASGSLTGSLFGSSSWATSASQAANSQTASYVLQAVSASFTSTASFVNPLTQNVTITGSLTVGSSSIGPVSYTHLRAHET